MRRNPPNTPRRTSGANLIRSLPEGGLRDTAANPPYELDHSNYFDVKVFFYMMFRGQVVVDGIKSSSVNITLTALSAYFRLYVLNDVKVASQPMLAFDPPLSRVTAAKLANHGSSVNAYTVIIMRSNSSLNLHTT